MRYVLSRAADDWDIDEIVDGDRRPCSDAYSRARAEHHVQIFRELVLLRAAGCPPDRALGNPEVEPWKGRCKKSHRDMTFFVLKAKPSGWRLYFTVPDLQHRRLVFLFSTQKKRNARNPEDFQKLCRLRGKLLDGTVSTEPLYIPPR